MALELPNEIWAQIGEYIPDYNLFYLKGVNIFFLNRWMNHGWKRVKIDTATPDSAVRICERVVDPFVATRPSLLHLRLRLIDCRSEQPLPNSSLTVSELMDRILQILPHLSNVDTLKIEICPDACPIMSTLFTKIASCAMGRTVRTLQLSGHEDMFCSLEGHPNPFENLTELSCNLYTVDRLRSRRIQKTFFAPFLYTMAPNIETLRISFSIDLSPLFHVLGQPGLFPNLKFFFLRLLYPPYTVHEFLFNHAGSLQRISLVFELKNSLWLSELVKTNTKFHRLHALILPIPNTPSTFSALITVIKRSPALVSLVVDGDLPEQLQDVLSQARRTLHISSMDSRD